jgi:hypothetical protein
LLYSTTAHNLSRIFTDLFGDLLHLAAGAIAHEALTYAHAAAVVRGCCFPLSPSLSAKRLQQLLPFVGAFTSRIIQQLLATGAAALQASPLLLFCFTMHGQQQCHLLQLGVA